MPWEAKRWVVFALLMVAMSLYALLYEPGKEPDAGGSSTGEAADTGTAGQK